MQYAEHHRLWCQQQPLQFHNRLVKHGWSSAPGLIDRENWQKKELDLFRDQLVLPRHHIRREKKRLRIQELGWEEWADSDEDTEALLGIQSQRYTAASGEDGQVIMDDEYGTVEMPHTDWTQFWAHRQMKIQQGREKNRKPAKPVEFVAHLPEESEEEMGGAGGHG